MVSTGSPWKRHLNVAGTLTFENLYAKHGINEVSNWLADFLPGQRWSGGRGHRITEVYVADAAEMLAIDDLVLLLVIVGVVFPDGQEEFYSVPLGIRNESDPWFTQVSPDV